MEIIKIDENKTANSFTELNHFSDLGSQTDISDERSIDILTRTNNLLVKENIRLQRNLNELTLKYHKALEENNKNITKLREEIKVLHKKIDNIIEARKVKFKLPKDWSEE